MSSNQEILLPANNPIYARIARVANRILKANAAQFEQLRDKEWTISVLEEETPNAFVLPVSRLIH